MASYQWLAYCFMTNMRKRSSSTIPFGWALHPKNEHVLVEYEPEQTVIEDLKKLRKTQSLRQLVTYIQAHTGRTMTPTGVSKLLKR